MYTTLRVGGQGTASDSTSTTQSQIHTDDDEHGIPRQCRPRPHLPRIGPRHTTVFNMKRHKSVYIVASALDQKVN